MKLFLVVTSFLVAFAAAEDFDFHDDFKISDEHKLQILKYAHECMKDQKVDYKEILELAGGSLSHPKENIKCFVNCFLEKAGFISDGDIKEDVILEKLLKFSTKDKATKFTESCHGIKGSSHCDIAYNLFECFYKHKKDLKS